MQNIGDGGRNPQTWYCLIWNETFFISQQDLGLNKIEVG